MTVPVAFKTVTDSHELALAPQTEQGRSASDCASVWGCFRHCLVRLCQSPVMPRIVNESCYCGVINTLRVGKITTPLTVVNGVWDL
jgi:hypothetical protein